ncbi:transcription antitermination factor NusB, partial [Pseudomonas guineae]|uniref:transcription antitermination factor NusB n=1 Tax=Pseudomonas guineae TaxID=425504 RepID=UPI0030EECB00
MNPRLAAARALAVVLNGKASLGSSLPPLLDKVELRDRGLTQDLAFGTARWQPRLALIAETLLQKPFKAVDRDVEALLLIGLYQLFYTRIPAHAAIGETVACIDKLKKPSLKGLLNAVLRNAQRDSESIIASLDRDPVLHTAHPRWLQKALK